MLHTFRNIYMELCLGFGLHMPMIQWYDIQRHYTMEMTLIIAGPNSYNLLNIIFQKLTNKIFI